jgi:hypothetical protein
VTIKYVIIHCSAHSSDGKFQGTAYDKKFLQWHQHRFKESEPNTVEHLSSGLPKVEEFEKLFPAATIAGKQNGEVWLEHMTQGRIPYVRLITGLYYKISLAKQDNLPPYHACLLVWRKT